MNKTGIDPGLDGGLTVCEAFGCGETPGGGACQDGSCKVRRYNEDLMNRPQVDPRLCGNLDCPYQNGEPCPAAEGCGGFEEGGNND